MLCVNVVFAMADFRAAMKFCFLLGKSGTETLEMLKTAYKDDAMGKTQVFEWFSRFKNGEMSIDDKPRSGRPSTARTHENVEKIREIIKEDRRRTIEEIVELSGVTSLSVRQFLTKNGMTPVPHPPYSPNLAPCDFFLFPRMKRDVKGKRFADVAEVKEKTTEALSSISKDEFRQCFEKWNKRLDKCISVSGEYFEGD
ncbi:hypothetical protein B7P43_G04958 [Cryptotermes secundus]|uniref:Mos1 transposase HTH domain-containing protein n=1 Tax=Cryptotermes secundus TaxID=105785 RepID=A0A2J7Q4S5_9NEOP|nr:hypothetical protein B7P43_G04958 [Cryptotermes secundus]